MTVTVPNGGGSAATASSVAAGRGGVLRPDREGGRERGGRHRTGATGFPALGDLTFNEAAASTADLVFAQRLERGVERHASRALGPVAVLGSGSAPVVIVDGDIVCDRRGRTGHNGTDVGDAFGVKNFVKRALNAGATPSSTSAWRGPTSATSWPATAGTGSAPA